MAVWPDEIPHGDLLWADLLLFLVKEHFVERMQVKPAIHAIRLQDVHVIEAPNLQRGVIPLRHFPSNGSPDYGDPAFFSDWKFAYYVGIVH